MSTFKTIGLVLSGVVLTTLCAAQSDTAHLKTVTVSAKKPFYETRSGRIAINVGSSVVSSGSSVLDILERSPGVIVSRQNSSITLNGKEGAGVMINGKVDHTPREAMVGLLQGMNSDNIEKIELIPAPPAGVDAEGNAGYINIILKNNPNSGVNGSYAATLGYGRGLVDEANVNVNYRQEKINLYGNYSYSRVKKPLPIHLYTKLPYRDDLVENRFAADRTEANRVINARLGMDYQVGPKTIIGVLVTGYHSKYTHSEHNENDILTNGHLDTVVRQANSEIKTWKNIGINLNMQQDFGGGGKLSANFDYIYYRNAQPYTYYAAYYRPDGNSLYDQHTQSLKITPLRFWIGALDYSQKLGKKVSWETGFKRTMDDLTNVLDVERLEQGGWKADAELSSDQQVKEDYTAVYTSFDLMPAAATRIKAGLRCEYTNYNLRTKDQKDVIDRHYGNLFPSLSWTQTLNAHSTLSLSYSRRISRPTFDQLAPFTYFLNGSTWMTGNPALQPSISNSITGAYTWKRYLFSLGFSKEDQAIAIFQPLIDTAAGKVLFTGRNLTDQKLLTAIVSVPVDIGNWWKMQYNFTGIWQQVDLAGGAPATRRLLNVNFTAIESFLLPKNYTLELSGFYQSARWIGTNRQTGYGSLDLGIRKKLPGTKGTLTLTASNILDSQDNIVTTEQPAFREAARLEVKFVQRSFKLTYTRSFGNDKLRASRERTTGAEDEKGRVQ
ncbi:MAG TPA: outer membrane beta-barrel family protein [Puia sp.]|nr:outer membrane beta-barrel family protein [Puia sp.]